MDILRDIVSKTNVYINSRGKGLNVDLVDYVARWVGQMLRMFGLGEGGTAEIGWGQEQKGDSFDVGPCIHVVVPLVAELSLVSEGRSPYAIFEGAVNLPGFCSAHGYRQG